MAGRKQRLSLVGGIKKTRRTVCSKLSEGDSGYVNELRVFSMAEGMAQAKVLG